MLGWLSQIVITELLTAAGCEEDVLVKGNLNCATGTASAVCDTE